MEANNDIWKKRKTKEKNLVTDQPGNFVLFIGIFISLILGFSLRSFTQSKFLNEMAAEATRNVGNDWKLSFEEVRIYLAEGLLPAVGLEVKKVRISSDSECFLKPSVEIDVVKVPVSFVELIFNRNPFSEIILNKTRIELALSKPNCVKKEIPAQNKIRSEPKQNKIVLMDKSSSVASKSQHTIKKVLLRNVEVHFLDGGYPQFGLNDLQIENKSEKPKILVLKTKIDISSLFRSKAGEIKTELNAEYNEFPEKILKVNLLGAIREGHFSVSLLNRMEERKYQIQADIKNLPVQKMLDFDIIKFKEDSPIKMGWVTFTAYSEGNVDHFESSKMEFKRIRLEGEFGDIVSDEINFPMGIKHQPEFFTVNLNNFKLDSFVEGNRLLKVPDQINSFGIVNGKLDYQSYDKISYQGKLSDLAFNFSSGGLRQVEKVDHILFQGELNREEFKFKSTEIFLKKKLEGLIEFNLKKDKSFQLKAEAKQIELSDKVSKLLTHKEQPVFIDSFKMKAVGDKKESRFNSKIEVAKLANQFLGIENASVEVDSTLNKEISIQVKAAKLNVDEQLKGFFVKNHIPVLESYNQVLLNYKSDYLKSNWTMSTASKWSSVGRWDSKGVLSGLLKASKQEWIIQGTRDEPQLFQKSP